MGSSCHISTLKLSVMAHWAFNLLTNNASEIGLKNDMFRSQDQAKLIIETLFDHVLYCWKRQDFDPNSQQ